MDSITAHFIAAGVYTHDVTLPVERNLSWLAPLANDLQRLLVMFQQASAKVLIVERPIMAPIFSLTGSLGQAKGASCDFGQGRAPLVVITIASGDKLRLEFTSAVLNGIVQHGFYCWCAQPVIDGCAMCT